MTGCPSPKHPTAPAGSLTLEIGGPIRGVAGDGVVAYAATGTAERTTLSAYRGNRPAWSATLAGNGGPLARTRSLVVAALAGHDKIADVAVRGAPAAVLAAFDGGSGAPRWKLPIDSSEWSVVTALAVAGDDVVVGGSFAGTLRAGGRVVSSAGKSDGFIAHVTAAGQVAWLLRTGGPGADAVQGIAVAGDRIAITGTFTAGAELLGVPFNAIDERAPFTDVFVAELDSGKAQLEWAVSFGGRLPDSVAGIAIDGKGRIAVAATVRDAVKIAGAELAVHGSSDGIVVFFSKDGQPGTKLVLGGFEFDGTSAIAAAGDQIVVGGFYAGQLQLGERALRADGGDDAYLVALDGGRITHVWPVAGPGREDITAIASVPGGFVAGVGHTAGVQIDGQPLASPKDPMSGGGLVIRAP
ncbi:MAG TPA: hypothetical protein VFQ53_01705 [Kofleriaceae bacterium]|nr:hypothetical protein [Kofleriaceae bacterium]